MPEKNYMVDVSEKARQIIRLIDHSEYFCMNRARQYGKTNMLERLKEMLSERYYVIAVSFQDSGQEEFVDGEAFVSYFMDLLSERMEKDSFPKALISKWNNPDTIGKSWVRRPFGYLRRKIAELCAGADRPIVLMIDEVDSASDNEVFLRFLGCLRENYLASQKNSDGETAFRSVILAGVTDIRNLKSKIRPEESHSLNSPWNIAAEFNVDMSFSAEEIAGMLREYDADHHVGMEIESVSREIRRLTSGYPYIVSWLCNWLDTDGRKNWTVEGIQEAGCAFRLSDAVLLDSVRGNIENHPDLKELLIQMMFYGKEYSYRPALPEVSLGVMYGLLVGSSDNRAVISNPLFEEYIRDYVVELVGRTFPAVTNQVREGYVSGGRLNMPYVLNRFQEFLTSEYRSGDGRFLERQGRLLFLSFIKPIINGSGHYYVEPQTRSNQRMDVVISYGLEEHIVELKIWDGPQYRENGIRQLEEYMQSRQAQVGYLLSFNFQKTGQSQRGWLSPKETGGRIYEVIVWCGGE